MKRREMLVGAGIAAVGLSAFPFRWVAAAERKKQKVLFFSRSAGFEHESVALKGNELSFADRMLIEWGQAAGFDVVCSKDGSIFDGDLKQFDAIAFYTSGDLTAAKTQKPQPGNAISPEGKKRFLAAIEAGKAFIGIHSATDTFRTDGIDPYIAMIGAEFIIHGAQQEATMKVVDPTFPGIEGLGREFTLHDEWYAFTKFADDLHVILVQETANMKGGVYKRPPYPATWARMHGCGRVFYTSMGHYKIWNAEQFRQVLLGGIAWALGNVDADIAPNIAQVTPGANDLGK